MRVLNIHNRIINQPKGKVAALFQTLAGKNDQIWPNEKWPAMKFKAGLKVGSAGGHGPIRYTVRKNIPGEFVQFAFTSPKGFDGTHTLEISGIEQDKTAIKHTIDMDATGLGLAQWALAIRWLHDALMEDAFDKVENFFSTEKKETGWTLWVKILRAGL